jgi:DNA-nicking Smr family endonuclease
MKSSKSSLTFKTFQDLRTLLEAKSFSLPDNSHSNVIDCDREMSPELEKELYKKAMEGVTPISRENTIEKFSRVELPIRSREKEDAEILSKLRDLVKYGTGFNVCETPEYIEGTGYHVHPEIARRLHRGDYSIQAYVDLHGLLVEEAKEVFEKFFKWAVTTGKTGVLIVHGRGLSSRSEPVLKKKVVEWLTRSQWRKWVVAYSSARRCDGGAGATYVLLRQHPITKRQKIKKAKTAGKN